MVYSDGKRISFAHSKGAEEGRLKCDVFNHGPGLCNLITFVVFPTYFCLQMSRRGSLKIIVVVFNVVFQLCFFNKMLSLHL